MADFITVTFLKGGTDQGSINTEVPVTIASRYIVKAVKLGGGSEITFTQDSPYGAHGRVAESWEVLNEKLDAK